MTTLSTELKSCSSKYLPIIRTHYLNLYRTKCMYVTYLHVYTIRTDMIDGRKKRKIFMMNSTCFFVSCEIDNRIKSKSLLNNNKNILCEK